MPLEMQGRPPCTLHAYGPNPAEVVIDNLVEIWNAEGPNEEKTFALTGPEQRLVRDGRAAQDLIVTPDADDQPFLRLDPRDQLLAAYLANRDRVYDWTIIAPSVTATFGAAAQGPAQQPPRSYDPATLSTAPPLKLCVASSQWIGPVWIDCDRTIVLPSRHLCLRAMAPPTWVDASSFRPGEGPRFEDAWNAWLWLRICKARSYPSGLPILTESVTIEADVVRTFVRRRGTRKIWFSSQATVQIWELLIANNVVGTIIIPANSFHSLTLAPGVTGFRNVMLPIVRDVTIAWEVQP